MNPNDPNIQMIPNGCLPSIDVRNVLSKICKKHLWRAEGPLRPDSRHLTLSIPKNQSGDRLQHARGMPLPSGFTCVDRQGVADDVWLKTCLWDGVEQQQGILPLASLFLGGDCQTLPKVACEVGEICGGP